MILTIHDMIKEMNKYENIDKKFSNLLNEAHSLAIELESHKNRQIEIGNNPYMPLNEEKYILKDYYFFKVLDGTYKKNMAISLTIVVLNHNNEELAFTYSPIHSIDDNLIMSQDGKGILKYYITVRNKVFDTLFDHEGNIRSRLSNNDSLFEFVDRERYSTYRFLLFD